MAPKPNSPSMPPMRQVYALVLVTLVALLWLLARPQQLGVQLQTLRPVRSSAVEEPQQPVLERLRIATYNIEQFTDGQRDGPERTPEVLLAQARGAADIIAEANPDILLLQEIENARALEILNAQLDEPYPYAYISTLRHSNGEKDKLNLGLLSRLRPQMVRELSFQKLNGYGHPTRGALLGKFDLGDDFHLLTYNIHLKSNFGTASRNQAQRAIALHYLAANAVSETLASHPRTTGVLILGDTNVDPDSPQFAEDPSLLPLAGAYVDLWKGRAMEERTTIPTRRAGDPGLVFDPSAFDRVFASHNLSDGQVWRVGDAQTIQRGTALDDNTLQPGHEGHVSDHYLTYVDLVRQPRTPDRAEPSISDDFDTEALEVPLP
ncbi:MAG: endonuclease/exonuclease/phosphatase family protein [Verrucomicrobiota bacterium]|nr:endonuclease/exonuclease/phosphatase family protein [Verrucomicrobiota bacterium]